MDRYLKKSEHNFTHEFTKLGPAVCVLGRSGIGKSWTVREALEPYVELTPDILRNKRCTVEFLERVHGTDIPVLLDEYEVVQDLVGIREIKGPPTNGLFVVVSQIPVKFDFDLVTYNFPVPTVEHLKKLFPGVSDTILRKANGDIRYVVQSLTMTSDDKDIFLGTREFLEGLVSKTTKIRPSEALHMTIHEPGNVLAILHENYTDSKTCDYAQVIDTLSEACIFETKLYEGHWDMYDSYGIMGCFLPAQQIGHSLKVPLRPGSVWTKHQSACARAKKLEALARRVPGKNLTIEEIHLLFMYAEREDLEVLCAHNLKPQDLDVLNHVSPFRKIKAKALASLKHELGKRVPVSD